MIRSPSISSVKDEGYWTKLRINRPAASFVLAPRGRSISKIPTN